VSTEVRMVGGSWGSLNQNPKYAALPFSTSESNKNQTNENPSRRDRYKLSDILAFGVRRPVFKVASHSFWSLSDQLG
jgi:hypothetical protein